MARVAGGSVSLSSTPDPVSLSEADRAIVSSGDSRRVRATLALLLLPYRPRIARVLPNLPSYVAEAVSALLVALDRWEHDEKGVSS